MTREALAYLEGFFSKSDAQRATMAARAAEPLENPETIRARAEDPALPRRRPPRRLGRTCRARRLRDGRDARGYVRSGCDEGGGGSRRRISTSLKAQRRGSPATRSRRSSSTRSASRCARLSVTDGRRLPALGPRPRGESGRVAPSRDTDPRVVAAISALRREPMLVEIAERAGQLDDRERRALLALMRELR